MKAYQHEPTACSTEGRNDQKCAYCQNEIRRATKKNNGRHNSHVGRVRGPTVHERMEAEGRL